jgi:hypothetical protein
MAAVVHHGSPQGYVQVFRALSLRCWAINIKDIWTFQEKDHTRRHLITGLLHLPRRNMWNSKISRKLHFQSLI